MGDNHYNKYLGEYPPPSSAAAHHHYQVKANVTSSSNTGNNNHRHHYHQQFNYDFNQTPGAPGAGVESNTHLSSLSNCVKRLQTQLNQYLTKIIDEGSDGPTNYNLGSGEVLNSHLMEQYSSVPNTAHSFNASQDSHSPQQHQAAINNGYSYYSNYPTDYSAAAAAAVAAAAYQPQPHQISPPSTHGAVYPGVDYHHHYNHHLQQQQQQQYSTSNFQEPKTKKHKK